jgi:hypothetical protein
MSLPNGQSKNCCNSPGHKLSLDLRNLDAVMVL